LSVLTGSLSISPPFTFTVEVNILLGSLISERAYLTPRWHSAPVMVYLSSFESAPFTLILQDMGQVMHVISLSMMISPLHLSLRPSFPAGH
jgi:hypothetical protein